VTSHSAPLPAQRREGRRPTQARRNARTRSGPSLPVWQDRFRSHDLHVEAKELKPPRSVSGFGRARTCAAWCPRTGPFEASMPPAERRVVDRFGLPAIHLSGSSEQVQRPWVRLPTVKFRNGCGEFRIRRNCVEQSHRRAEFDVVRTAEDFVDGPALDGSNERGTIPEPGSQDAVPKIGDGLVV